jgi:hypothetical protein
MWLLKAVMERTCHLNPQRMSFSQCACFASLSAGGVGRKRLNGLNTPINTKGPRDSLQWGLGRTSAKPILPPQKHKKRRRIDSYRALNNIPLYF